MSFGIALSGISAAQTDLNATANNIANSQTVGFKESKAQFAELFAVSSQGVSNNQTGIGVKVAAISQQFAQGDISSTGNSLDLAISGQGFFRLSDSGAAVFSRAGSFTTDKNGFVTNSAGQRLQVYPTTTTNTFNTTTTTDLQLVTGDSAPQPTANVNIAFNLAGNAAQPATAVFNPADPTSYNNSTSMTLYDSLGAAHTASVYFVKTATVNSWNARLYIDGTAVGVPQALTYSNAGALLTPATGTVPFPAYTPATGAANMTVTFNMAQSTQYGSNFSVTSVQQDGFTTGKLIGINVDATGVVQARYTNGRSTPLGQIAVSNFADTQGLQQIGNTNWAETNASGQPLNGQAGNSGFGLIQSGSLEQSNVDITAQLVNMITAQRDFQANAQIIQTENQISQTLINLR
jgi:flagellar hook protein FlgE